MKIEIGIMGIDFNCGITSNEPEVEKPLTIRNWAQSLKLDPYLPIVNARVCCSFAYSCFESSQVKH